MSAPSQHFQFKHFLRSNIIFKSIFSKKSYIITIFFFTFRLVFLKSQKIISLCIFKSCSANDRKFFLEIHYGLFQVFSTFLSNKHRQGGFHQLGPLGRVGLVVAMSVCLSVCIRHRVQFFFKAIRSHEQIPTSHWSTPPPPPGAEVVEVVGGGTTAAKVQLKYS